MKQRLQGMVIGFTVALMLLGTVTVLAATATRSIEVTYGVNVVANGAPHIFQDDTQPFMFIEQIFLSIWEIADALNLDRGWDPATSTVYLDTRRPRPSPSPFPDTRNARHITQADIKYISIYWLAHTYQFI